MTANDTKNLQKPFLTQDLYMASFLCYKGLTLLGTTQEEDGPRKFILVDRDDREELVEQWVSGTGEGLICKLYAGKMRMVKKTLYGDKE